MRTACVAVAMCLVASSSASRLAPGDRAALLALYGAAGGAGWFNASGWAGAGSPCGWAGVTCDATGARVVAL